MVRVSKYTQAEIKKMSNWDLSGALKFVNEDLISSRLYVKATVENLRKQRKWIEEEMQKRKRRGVT